MCLVCGGDMKKKERINNFFVWDSFCDEKKIQVEKNRKFNVSVKLNV
jgi:hypothetical protein